MQWTQAQALVQVRWAGLRQLLQEQQQRQQVQGWPQALLLRQQLQGPREGLQGVARGAQLLSHY